MDQQASTAPAPPPISHGPPANAMPWIPSAELRAVSEADTTNESVPAQLDDPAELGEPSV
jgi:hypothetical protein